MTAPRSLAIRVRRHGGPEVLVSELMVPRALRPGEALVRVVAAGVSYADTQIRRGVYPLPARLPLTPGYDVVGVVEAVTPPCGGLEVGECVAGFVGRGGYAEHVVARCDRFVPVPPGVDPAEAVSLVLNYTTAFQMLNRVATVRPGQAVVVQNAAGGVGTALVQLARRAGVTVYGTASSGKLDLVAALGGIPIDYRRQDVAREVRARDPRGVDAVFEGLGQGWWAARGLLSRRGRLVIYGVGATSQTRIAMAATLARRLGTFAAMKALPGPRVSFYSFPLVALRRPEWIRSDLTELLRRLARSELRPVIAEKLPLARAADAHRALESGNVRGKIVLAVSSDSRCGGR
jgi:NADPH2:quinone reductase